MEGCPRLPTIGFEAKTCVEAVNLCEKIPQYITSNYQESGDKYTSEYEQINRLRQTALSASTDESGVALLKRYFCQLQLLRNRFPMLPDTECAVRFTWEDAFQKDDNSFNDVRFEEASVLYNIGAMYSRLGANENRKTAESIKNACISFRCAAACYEKVRDHYTTYTADLTPDLLTCQLHILLAQAHESVLEKSLLDQRPATVNAHLAMQISEYYQMALLNLTKSGINSIVSKRYREWRVALTYKLSHYLAVTYYCCGLVAEEGKKRGQAVCYYEAAVERLKEAWKNAEKISSDKTVIFKDAHTFTNDVLMGKFKSAKRDNDCVYFEKVPTLASLPAVQGVIVAKPQLFDCHDADVSGTDIFHKLVPLDAHLATSEYSEEKAKLLREIIDLTENKTRELETFVRCLQLDRVPLNDEYLRLPRELLDCCAAVAARPTMIKDLASAMQQLNSQHHDVTEQVNDFDQGLKTIEQTTPSITSNKDFKDLHNNLTTINEMMLQANASNIELHRHMTNIIEHLKILASPLQQMEQTLPLITELDDDSNKPKFARLALLNEKVETMRKQREMLLTDFRRKLQDDDITKLVLMQRQDNHQTLFAAQMKKHEELVNILKQNCLAQDNILQSLTEANADIAQVRMKITTTFDTRQRLIDDYINSFKSFEDTLAKANEGIDFYKKQATKLVKLQERLTTLQSQQAPQIPPIPNRASIPSRLSSNVPSRFHPIRSNFNTDSLPLDYEMNDFSAPSPPPPPPPPQSSSSSSSIPDRPRLKDYLAAMKPDTWGGAGAGAGAGSSSTRSSKRSSNRSDDSFYTLPPPLSHIPDHLAFPRDSTPSFNSRHPQWQPSIPTDPPSMSYAYPPAPPPPPPSQQQQHFTLYQPSQTMDLSSMRLGHNVAPPTSMSHPSTTSHSFVQQPIYRSETMNPSYLPPQQSRQQQQLQEQQQLQQHLQQQQQQQQQQQWQQQQQQLQEQQQQYHHHQQQQQQQLQQPFQPSPAPSQNYYPPPPVQQPIYQPFVPPPPQSSSQQPYPPTLYNQQPIYQTPHPPSSSYPYPQPSAQQVYQVPPPPPPSIQPTNDAQQPPALRPKFDPYRPQPLGAYDIPQLPKSSFTPPPAQQQQQPNPATTIPTTRLHPQDVYRPGALLSTNQSNMPTPSFNNNHHPTPSPSPSPPPPPIAPAPLASASVPPTTTSPPAQSSMTSIADDLLSLALEEQLQNTTILQTEALFAQLQPQPQPPSQPAVSVEEDVQVKSNGKPIACIQPLTVMFEEKQPIQSVVAPAAASLSPPQDPYDDREKLDQLVADVQRFEKHVSAMTNRMLNGTVPLELEWKELADSHEKDVATQTCAIGKCNPKLNRFQDLIPYDQSRVRLQQTTGSASKHFNDYINATTIGRLRDASLLISQYPLATTIGDFWSMIYDQHVAIVALLLRKDEMQTNVCPEKVGDELKYSPLTITLISTKTPHPLTNHKIIRLHHSQTNQSRTVVWLEHLAWPHKEMPEHPAELIKFIRDVQHFLLQTRNPRSTILVTCLSGVSRTGPFLSLFTCLQDVDEGRAFPDLNKIIRLLRSKRRHIIQDMNQLKFVYEALLFYLQDRLVKRGVLKVGAMMHPLASISSQSTPIPTNTLRLNDELQIIMDQAKPPIPSTPNYDVGPILSSTPTSTAIEENKQPAKQLSPIEENFNLRPEESHIRPKTSRDDFFRPKTSLTTDLSDPFNQLDPHWTFR